MKNLFFILIVCCSLNGFGQDVQLIKDFIEDKDGTLGLRSKYLDKYEFNKVGFFKCFEGKTKGEIIKLLGPPNQTISVVVNKRGEKMKVVESDSIRVDDIVYFVNNANLECNRKVIIDFPMIPFEPEDIAKGKIKAVIIMYHYKCENESKKDRTEEAVRLEFSFYLGEDN